VSHSASKAPGVFAHQRMIYLVIALLFANGVLAWFSTPREEDPQLAARHGIITCIFPGNTPADMERLVAKPIEDELAQVDSIKTLDTRLRSDFLFMEIRLKENVGPSDAKAAWDRVQQALDRAQKRLPETAGKPDLNRDVYDQDAVLLVLSGSKDPLALLDESRLLKDSLQAIPGVKTVDVIASPGEQMTVRFDEAALRRHGVQLDQVLGQLKGGNAFIPSGYVRLGERKLTVLTNSYFRSVEELRTFPVQLKSGESLPLSALGTIERSTSEPEMESMRHRGERAMGLGVVAQKNVNLQEFGKAVRKAVADIQTTPGWKASGLKAEEISYQPKYVDERIFEIGMDLLKAIFLVGGLLVLMLGLRVGSIVALQVPVVTVIAFGLFSQLGGVLNQVSLAAFILAIGLLVDNVVVMVDGVQEKLDRGFPPEEAAEQTRKEYLVPLAAGTLTTIAAFIPILASHGVTADFVRAVGVVSTIALTCSYFFCIFGTTLIASRLLKKGEARQWRFVEPLGAKLGFLARTRTKSIVLGAVAAVLVAGVGFSFVKKQFFPLADRDMLIVELKLPEGTHYQETKAETAVLEEAISKDPRVLSVTSLIGRGVPLFYYNLPREPNAPHLAQMIVRFHSPSEAKRFKADKEGLLQSLTPYGTLIVREIAQGPPVKAPVEVRIYSRDPAKLEQAVHAALRALRTQNSLAKVHSTLGTGILALRLAVDDSSAGAYGIPRSTVSGAVLENTLGIPVTTYRGGTDPCPITLRSGPGEEVAPEALSKAYLGSTRTEDLDVGMLTRRQFEMTPSIIEHRNRMPLVSVLAELAPGASENVATAQARAAMEALPKVDGVTWEMGGAAAESGDATGALAMALPLGLFVLLMSLMFEFNSYRRIGIILMTIPLCAVGSVPGLLLTHSTFGFMTLLGFFTLAGTVIHNGIFLIDYLDRRREAGVDMDQAMTEAIQRRMRPILLTASATIVELLPLTMTRSTLWPPFAWAIIWGLAVSTLLTLLVLPSVFKLLFKKEAAS
jgi:multidrug efflux pump subunit AcrB